MNVETESEHSFILILCPPKLSACVIVCTMGCVCVCARAGLKLKIEKNTVHQLSYALFPTLSQSTPVDWTLLELEKIEGEHIRCHELLGNEVLEDLFERYKIAESKAVVLINTTDNYSLPPDLISDAWKPSLPVIVLTKSDGQQIVQCLEDTSEIGENVYGKIEVETDVDGGIGEGMAVGGTQQGHASPQGTPKKKQVHQSPPDSSISKSIVSGKAAVLG